MTSNRRDRVGRAWKRGTAGLGMVVALMSLSVLPASAASVISTIPVGGYPVGVAFTPDGSTAYVTNLNGNTVPVSVGSPAAVFSITAGALPTPVLELALVLIARRQVARKPR